ncbi:MAG: TonB-dependent receptor [Hyphomicrobium sp.]
MKSTSRIVGLAVGSVTLLAGHHAALAQQAPVPAAPAAQNQLPPVDVIQKKAPAPAPKQQAAPQPKVAPKAAQPAQQASPPPKAKPKVKQAVPAPQPQPEVQEVVEQAPSEVLANTPYGAPGGAAAAERAQNSATSPVNPTMIVPGNLQGFAGAASRVDKQQIDEQRPLTNHDALARVPGIVTTTDDGMARHSGIGIRGAPFRRSRKTLVMEDGQTINQASYIDASTHYTPPIDRIESIEVLRGTVISHGPLNNHGVVNFRNLSPFGPNETVISGSIGVTEGSDKSVNNSRHIHTRQNVGNVGIVASYSGADAGGAWDNEVLRFNDFYGAIGFKGSNQDLTISGGHFRQRDRYDEVNFIGSSGPTAKAEFFANGRRKAGGLAVGFLGADGTEDGLQYSSYNGDLYRLMVSHNWYITPNTTITTKLFGSDLDRARFYPVDAGPDNGDGMEGRDRRYSAAGADSRIEFANVPLVGAIKQDIQAGVHYERQAFRDARTAGAAGEILDFDNRGAMERLQKYDADAFSAFIQSTVHLTSQLTVTPGVRFENYDLSRTNFAPLPGNEVQASGSQDFSHVLPGVAVAWEVMPRSTLYAGYHRGVTPSIARGEVFPLGEEVGDNYQVGVRSTAIRGLSLDIAYFHSDIRDYQIKTPFTIAGQNVFGSVDKVDIDGVELYARLDSRPFTGGPFNVFGEVVYTFTDSRIEAGGDPAKIETGNRVPETMRHFANLTLGVAHQAGWDASVTMTYRGDFFTDTENFVEWQSDGDTLTGGLVDDVWLLSARGSVKLSDSMTLFLSGHNLTNEFYVSDLSDGAKPGHGRTITGGFKLKLN